VLHRRKYPDYGRKTHVRTVARRIRGAVGPPHPEARHVGRSGVALHHPRGPHAGLVTGSGKAGVMRRVFTAGVPRAAGLSRAGKLARPRSLHGPTGIMPFGPRAATNDRDCLGAALPIRNQAIHSHPGGTRNSARGRDLSLGRMGSAFRGDDDDPPGLTNRRSAPAPGDPATACSGAP
jgi:hypothetical protein